MNAIKENPYRTLGLFGNTTEKELQKQIAIIKRYTEVGKSKSFDFDFPFLGDFKREQQTVKDAASKIEQAKNKVLYALFWFIKNDPVDEVALNHLKDGNLDKAIEIWEKTLKDSVITAKNFSAISNLSTLQLAVTTNNGSFDVDKFNSSMDLKGKLLTSDFFNNFISTVAGNEMSISRVTIIKDFADEILQIINPYLLKPAEKSELVAGRMDDGVGFYRWDDGALYFGEWKNSKRTGLGIYLSGSGHYYLGNFNLDLIDGEGLYLYPDGSKNIGTWMNGMFQPNPLYDIKKISKDISDRFAALVKKSGINFNALSIVQFIQTFRNFPDEIKQYIISKFTDKPVSQIEGKLEECRNKRTGNASEAIIYGEELLVKTKSDLILLKNVFSESSLRYQMISNKIAEEVLQCAIDYINFHSSAGSFDPIEKAMHLLQSVKTLNPTGKVKARLEENEIIIQNALKQKAENERVKNIQPDIEFIGETLKQFQKLPQSITNVQNLLSSCKPKLDSVKKALGQTNDFYIQLSSAVVSHAQGMLVASVNNEQAAFTTYIAKTIDKSAAISQLGRLVQGSISLLKVIGSYDMSPELRNNYNSNLFALQNIITQLNATGLYDATKRPTIKAKNDGCYIATMAYGSYDHPQVLELRKFRDEVLAHSRAGRIFIALYYKISPRLVSVLKNKPAINSAIRTLLNHFTGMIK
jgi:hypothetical protein